MSCRADWEDEFLLGSACKIKHGYACKGNLMTTEECNRPIVVNIVNFQYAGGFRFGSTKIQRYLGSYPEEYELRPGQVLLVMTCQTPKGEILGVPGKIPNDGSRYLHNQRMGLVQITDSAKLDLGFVYWLCLSQRFNQHLFATASGAKILHTAPSRIEAYTFSRPPVHTQRKIAATLSAYDDLIENNTRRIQILEEMAQAIYREWFVNFRFPGHENVKMVESELGLIPEGWEVKALGDVAEINSASVKPADAPKVINYIDIASVSPGQIDEVREMALADAPGRARRIVKHGDVLWSTVRPNRRSYALVQNPLPHMVASTGFAVISARSSPYCYLYEALITDAFVGYLVNHAKGSAYPAVNKEDFDCAPVLVPPARLLEQFDGNASSLLALADNLRQKKLNLRRTRDLLLPKLVSGEVDVSELEIDIGAEDRTP